jgi:gliding motility-associated-like protein
MTGLNGSQGAGTWTDNDASDALAGNIFNPLAAGAGTFHFTYTVGGGISPCQFDTATVTVVVSPEPNAGTFAGVQNVCASAGTFDLETLLNNEQTGGTWTDVNNLPITNPLNVSTLTAGTYSYTYTIANACGNDTETVQLTILPSPALAIPNITIITPICLSDNATISFSGMVNGTYAITYSLSGSNILANQSVNVTIAGGTGSLTIPAANITNIGTTTITFINIANSVTNCTTTLTNIQVNFVIGPVSNIDPVNLIASTTCFGNAVPITIANETGLPDGNYQFNYAIPNATPSTGITEIVAISQGNGTFTLPTSTFPIADNYTFTITGISSLSSGCNNLNVNVSASVDLTICDEDLLIPDGFSPNGDNINDNFEILHLSELYPKFKLEIYNRYGNILYKGNINTPNWNGTSSEGGIKMGNGVVPVGVYFYILEFNDGTRKPTQGRLYLSR